jgi:hypothetical protein
MRHSAFRWVGQGILDRGGPPARQPGTVCLTDWVGGTGKGIAEQCHSASQSHISTLQTFYVRNGSARKFVHGGFHRAEGSEYREFSNSAHAFGGRTPASARLILSRQGFSSSSWTDTTRILQVSEKNCWESLTTLEGLPGAVFACVDCGSHHSHD